MTRYHINPETLLVGVCSAKIKCDFSENGNEPKHYSSEKEAYATMSNIFEEDHGLFASHKKIDHVLEKKKDKIYNSKELHTKDAEEVRDFPVHIIDPETASSQLATRVSKDGNNIYHFYDKESNLIQSVKWHDTVFTSEYSAEEMLGRK